MFDGSDSTEKPSVEELYEVATNTSDLSHHAERRTSADILRDMAMSMVGLGGALRHLLGEWSAASKPKPPNRAMIDALASKFRADDAKAQEARTRSNGELARLKELQAKQPDWDRAVEIFNLESLYAKGALPLPELKFGDPRVRAEVEAERWFTNEMRLLANSLKSRGAVWTHLHPWIEQNAMEPSHAAAVLLHWLHPICHACSRRRWAVVPGTARLSGKVCEVCRGTGESPVPHGQLGRKLANHLDQCLFRYKQHMAGRRSALAKIPPIDRLSKRMQPGGDED